MSIQGYPEAEWAQHACNFSENKSMPNIGGSEAQGHAVPIQYNPQMESSGPYEGHVGASSESRPGWYERAGADDEQ